MTSYLNKNFFAFVISLLILIVVVPTFKSELFPFSTYPMLSEAWKGYSWVDGKTKEAEAFLKKNNVNSNYFGVPQDLKVGRSYPQTLLLFGKKYSLEEVKLLMGLLSFDTQLCFTLKNFEQNSKGAFIAKDIGDFCLGSSK